MNKTFKQIRLGCIIDRSWGKDRVYNLLNSVLDENIRIESIHVGARPGADRWVALWAIKKGIPVFPYPMDSTKRYAMSLRELHAVLIQASDMILMGGSDADLASMRASLKTSKKEWELLKRQTDQEERDVQGSLLSF